MIEQAQRTAMPAADDRNEPVAAIKTVSHDITLQATVDSASLGRCTAIELQWEFLRLAQKYADETGLETAAPLLPVLEEPSV